MADEWNAFSRKRTTRSVARLMREERQARFKRLRQVEELTHAPESQIPAPIVPSQVSPASSSIQQEELVQTRVDGAFPVKKPMTLTPKSGVCANPAPSSALASAEATPKQVLFVSPPMIQRTANELEALASMPPSTTSAPTPAPNTADKSSVDPTLTATVPAPVLESVPAPAAAIVPSEKITKFRSGGSSSRRMISFSPDSKPSKPSPPEQQAMDQLKLERHRKQNRKLLERMERAAAAAKASSASLAARSSSSSSSSPSRSASPSAGASAVVASAKSFGPADDEVGASTTATGEELSQSTRTMPLGDNNNNNNKHDKRSVSDQSRRDDIPYNPSPASTRPNGPANLLASSLPNAAGVHASIMALSIAQTKSPAAGVHRLHRRLADEFGQAANNNNNKMPSPSDEISCKTEKENQSASNTSGSEPANDITTPRKPKSARTLPTSIGSINASNKVTTTRLHPRTNVSCSPSTSTLSAAPAINKQTPLASSQTIKAGAAGEFTSTSKIEDVGLFNCELDVEYTGGVYGEGTDGKVSAAVIRGQKVALKRAKPHEGFPEEEAKRRSAIELHYLRRVRHQEGFLQCLGVCDGIDHTCIALEVMDCKLSDYLRRKARQAAKKSTPHHFSTTSCSTPETSKQRHRRYMLSIEETRALLKKICQPLMHLHDQVNVAHGDLACRNILLRLPPRGYEDKWEPVVKLSDFGRIKTPSSEPKILDESFSFFKNCDIGAFAREILFRLLVGEIVPNNSIEQRTLHKHLQDSVVVSVSEAARTRLGVFYRLFRRCTSWGVRPSFREIYEHLDDLEYFDTSENGLFPIKPLGVPVPMSMSMSMSMPGATGNASANGNGNNGKEPPNFMSPLMETAKLKAHLPPSSCSKVASNKFETPKASFQRHNAVRNAANNNAERESLAPPPPPPPQPTTATPTALIKSSSKLTPNKVNWLKARPVGPCGATTNLHHHLLQTRRPGVNNANTTTPKKGVSPMLTKPEPLRRQNSTGGHSVTTTSTTTSTTTASRRSLQILNKLVSQQRDKTL